jgi:hypothetical protein
MEFLEVYHQAMATWIIARVTDGKCEGAEFVFDLIESAIRKEATEILLIYYPGTVCVLGNLSCPHR